MNIGTNLDVYNVAKTASAWEAPGGLSDQLAAGIIAYILLAGYPPFNGKPTVRSFSV
jgi:hypothetical protein